MDPKDWIKLSEIKVPCNKCGQTKSIIEFSYMPSRNRYSRVCNECNAGRSREYRKNIEVGKLLSEYKEPVKLRSVEVWQQGLGVQMKFDSLSECAKHFKITPGAVRHRIWKGKYYGLYKFAWCPPVLNV